MSRHRVRILLTVFGSSALFAAVCLGDRLPSSIKSSTSPGASHGAIQKIIDAQAAQLAGDDIAAQKSARTTLVFECESHAGATASGAYQTEYAHDMSSALLPLLQPDKPIRVRLNAAVAVGEVAGKIYKNGAADQFSKITTQLLSDKDSALVLWGVKIAKYVIGNMIQRGTNVSALNGMVVKAVKDHPDAGAIAEEAYAALTLEPFHRDPQIATLAAATLPDLLSLVEWRAEQYRTRPTPPPSPQAEHRVTVFLPVTAYAAVAANPQVKEQTLKAMGDLTCAVVNSVAGGNTDADTVDMARELGKAIVVFGVQMQNPGLQAAGQSIADISATTTPDTMTARCGSLSAALKAMGVTLNASTGVAEPTVAGSTK